VTVEGSTGSGFARCGFVGARGSKVVKRPFGERRELVEPVEPERAPFDPSNLSNPHGL